MYQGGGRWSKIRRGKGVRSEYYALHLSPLTPPTAAIISKSDMAGRINDCELLTLTRSELNQNKSTVTWCNLFARFIVILIIGFIWSNYFLVRRLPYHANIFSYCHRYVFLLPFDYCDNKLGIDTYLVSFIFVICCTFVDNYPKMKCFRNRTNTTHLR